ncbi:MAG: hypothetical protein JXR07_15350 [Reichenbachiella sp.]
MKAFIRSVVLSIMILSAHILMGLLYTWIANVEYGGFYGLMGGLLYYLVFAYWAYLLLSLLFVSWVKNHNGRKDRYLKATLVLVVGYFFSRIPDIIDSDFFTHFSISGLLIFIALIPVLVECELYLHKLNDSN